MWVYKPITLKKVISYSYDIQTFFYVKSQWAVCAAIIFQNLRRIYRQSILSGLSCSQFGRAVLDVFLLTHFHGLFVELSLVIASVYLASWDCLLFSVAISEAWFSRLDLACFDAPPWLALWRLEWPVLLKLLDVLLFSLLSMLFCYYDFLHDGVIVCLGFLCFSIIPSITPSFCHLDFQACFYLIRNFSI